MSLGAAFGRMLKQREMGTNARVGALPITAMCVSVGIYAFINPQLLSDFQLQTVADQVAPLGLISLAELLVVLTGGIDVSIGAMLSLTDVVFVTLLGHVSVSMAIVATLVIAMLCGAINGALAAIGNLPTIVATLATGFIYGAVAVEVMDAPGGNVPSSVISMTSGSVTSSVPAAAAWLFVVGGLVWALVGRSVFGRLVIGIGSSSSGVRAVGRNVAALRIATFAFGGLLTGLAAIVLVGTTATGDPRAGDPYLLNVIAAVALGGARFTGGVGSVPGTIAAAIILTLISSILFFAGINSFWQYVVSAGIIVTVVGLPQLMRIMRATEARELG